MSFKPKRKTIWVYVALAGFALGTAAVAYLIIQINASKRELAGVIRANPTTSAVVAYTFDEHGEPVEDGYSLFYNPDTPLVMASTMKTLVLLAYEQAVAQGVFDPSEQVSVADLERYYLPKTDGGAHQAGLASLNLKTDPSGFASDPQAQIALDDIARIMIHYSGNAETDYLIGRLGAERIARALEAAGFTQHTPVWPTLGTSLMLLNHEAPLVEADRRQALIQAITRQDFSVMDELIDKYLHDPVWRAAQIDWMQSAAFTTATGQMGWSGQVQASYLFPRGTAREYARLMARIASGKLVSAEVSTRMQQKLESVPTDWPLRLVFHRRYGAKDGLTAGVLTLASYAVPKNGPLAGQQRVVVVLTNDLPLNTWQAQVQAQGIYFLQTDLASGSGIFEKFNRRQ